MIRLSDLAQEGQKFLCEQLHLESSKLEMLGRIRMLGGDLRVKSVKSIDNFWPDCDGFVSKNSPKKGHYHFSSVVRFVKPLSQKQTLDLLYKNNFTEPSEVSRTIGGFHLSYTYKVKDSSYQLVFPDVKDEGEK